MAEPDWEKLREKFPRELITKVQKRGGKYDTVNHAAVTDRLIRYAGDWTYHVEPVTVVGGDGLPHVVAVLGDMTIGGVTRMETGSPEKPSDYGQELKEAISDFIKRGAMRFGVALDLWSKEELQQDVDGSTAATFGEHASAAPNREPATAGNTERGPSATSAGPGAEGLGEGSEVAPAPADLQRFITKQEANKLVRVFKGAEPALAEAQRLYGDAIEELTDLTFGQARDMLARQPA